MNLVHSIHSYLFPPSPSFSKEIHSWLGKHQITNLSHLSISQKEEIAKKAKKEAFFQKSRFYLLVFTIATVATVVLPLFTMYYIHYVLSMISYVWPSVFPLVLFAFLYPILTLHFLALKYLCDYYSSDLVPINNFSKELKEVASFLSSTPTKNYSQLRLTTADRKKIKEILEITAEKSKTELLFQHHSHLKKLGREIDGIHPFRFLEAAYCDANSRAHLKKIKKDGFKWPFFEKDLEKAFKDRDQQHTLLPYLSSFCRRTKLPYEKIRSLVEQKRFKEIIRLFVEK